MTVRDPERRTAPKWAHHPSEELHLVPLGVESPGTVVTADVDSADAAPSLVAGVATFTDCRFDWTHPRDEVIHILAGELRMTSGGQELVGRPGDIIFVGKGAEVTYVTDGECRLFAAQSIELEGVGS